jgi:predicted nuclease of predicted toxin-antitoxin system
LARFFLDESLPPELAPALRDLGHEAIHAFDVGMAGSSDDDIYAKAGDLDAILITLDLDFSDIRGFGGPTPIIVLRLHGSTTRRVLSEFVTTRVVRYRADTEELRDAIMILEPRRSRIRRKY